MQNEKPLKEVIREFVEHYRLEKKLNEVTLIEKWEEVVGKMIAKHTTNIHIDKCILYVEVDSSIVRSELNLIKTAIILRLNGYFKKPMIDKIVLK
jgi:predicted nucleic acid-binding Zn ribbon protein